MENENKQTLTEDQIRQVQEAIRQSDADMEEWRRLSRVDPEKMRQPLTPWGLWEHEE